MVYLLSVVLPLTPTRLPMGPFHTTSYSFLKNITNVLYQLRLKPSLPYYFTENGFSVPVSTCNSNLLIGLKIPQVVNVHQYLFMMSYMFSLHSTIHNTHLSYEKIYVSSYVMNLRTSYRFLGGRCFFV